MEKIIGKVVHLTTLEEGIVQIQMKDEAAKNMLSESLIKGLGEAFETAGQDESVKVIILTGYDNYFVVVEPLKA